MPFATTQAAVVAPTTARHEKPQRRCASRNASLARDHHRCRRISANPSQGNVNTSSQGLGVSEKMAWSFKPLVQLESPNHKTQPKHLASVRDTLKHWELHAGTKAVLALPTSFVAGQAMLIRALEGAWDLELVEPSSSPSWNEPKDFVALTPHQAHGWLQNGCGKTKTLLLGGGPISASLVAEASQDASEVGATA